jgi:hypothetical protein
MLLTFENILELVEHIIKAIETESLHDYLYVLRFSGKTYGIEDEQFFIELISILMN